MSDGEGPKYGWYVKNLIFAFTIIGFFGLIVLIIGIYLLGMLGVILSIIGITVMAGNRISNNEYYHR